MSRERYSLKRAKQKKKLLYSAAVKNENRSRQSNFKRTEKGEAKTVCFRNMFFCIVIFTKQKLLAYNVLGFAQNKFV